MEILKQILMEFLRLDGVTAAVVIGRDGFVIEDAVSGEIDTDALGAMASTGMGTSEAMGAELGKGELN
jgi:predicted regulator of Ras-like GTPase activity (Roadblock/LC7/MglB family)